MNFSQCASVLEVAVRTTIATGESVTPFLWGPPGVGKSACVYRVACAMAKKLGLKGGVLREGESPAMGLKASDYYGFIDLRLSQIDAIDVGGAPKVDEEQNVTRRILGDWWPHAGRDDLPEYGVIFLDEWPNASPSTQNASYQLACDRRLANKPLKAGWATIGAGNRMTDGGGTYKQSLPLSNRLMHIDFASDPDDFVAYGARTGKIEPWILAFIRTRPDLLNTFETHVREKRAGQAFATERTWEKVSLVSSLVGSDIDALRPFLCGYLGDHVATSAVTFRTMASSLVAPADILADPENAHVPTENSALCVTMTALARAVTLDNFGQAMRYLGRIKDRSWASLFMKDATSRDRSLTSHPEFIKWAPEFLELLS